MRLPVLPGAPADIPAPLFDKFDAAIGVYEASGRCLYANAFTCQTFGVAPEQLLGKVLWEVFPDVVGTPFHRAFLEAATTGAPQRFEHHYPPIDRWFDDHIYVSEGKLWVMSLDITERRRAEAREQAASRRLSALGEVSRALVESGLDREVVLQTTVRKVVEAVADLSAVYRPSADGRTLQPVAFHDVDPALSGHFAELLARRPVEIGVGFAGQAAAQRRTLHANHLPRSEFAARSAPEHRPYLEQFESFSLVAVPLLLKGELVAVLGALRRAPRPGFEPDDLTFLEELAQRVAAALHAADLHAEASESRSRLRAITDALPPLIAYVDRDHRYRHVNRAYERWFNKSAAEYLGRHVREFMGTEGYSAVLPRMKDAFAGRQIHFETKVQYPDGVRWVEATYVPDVREDGTVAGYVSLVEDITERHRSEQERAELLGRTTAAYEAERVARDRAERLAERSRQLARATERLSGSLDAGEVATVVLEEGAAALGALNGAIWLRQEDELELFRAVGFPTGTGFERLPLDRTAPIARAVLDNTSVWLEDWESYAREYPESEQRSRGSKPPPDVAFACLPLRIEGRCIGGLVLTFSGRRVFHNSDRDFIEILVRHCAQALDRARLFEHALRAADAARFLDEATAELSGSLQSAEVFERVAQLAVPRLGDGCVVVAVDPDGGIAPVAIRHRDPVRAGQLTTLMEKYPPRPDGSVGAAASVRTGQALLVPVVTPELLDRVSSSAEHRRLFDEFGLSSMMTVPLSSNGKTLGALTLMSSGAQRRYDEAALALAQEFARRAALAVENAQLLRETRAAVTLRDEFLSVASHELKTPVTSLRLQIQTLQTSLRREGFPLLEAKAARIDHAIDRLSGLVDTLLDSTRVSGGRFSLSPAPLDLGELVREVAERFVDHARAQDVRLEVDAPEGIRGEWDGERLDQLVTNLLGNALKYGIGKPVAVKVSLEQGLARVAVADQGIGIDPADQARIFRQFERASSVRNYGGLGLGLWIANEIATAHGGRLSVKSEPGRGATFELALPLAVPSPG